MVAPIFGPRACRHFVRFLFDPVACIIDMHRRYGRVSAIGDPFGRKSKRVFALALGPELNRQVFSDPALFRTTGQLRPGPKDSALRRVRFGLTRMQGEKHRAQRRLLGPLFAKSAVDRYTSGFVDVTRDYLDRWTAGTTVDMAHEMHHLSMRISAETLFGRDPLGHTRMLADCFGRLIRYTFAKRVLAFPFDLPGTPYRGMLQTAEQIEDALLATIAQRRREPPPEHPDLLDRLIAARDDEVGRMDDRDLVGQSTILFNASFETTASGLLWTLFLLAQHPAVLDALIAEVQEHLGDDLPDATVLREMPLLDRVIKESMRVLPPVPLQPRTVTAEVDLPGLTLRRGDRVIVSSYITHHLPELYPEPKLFRPERWEKQPVRDRYEYLPFSAGPRLCIGADFATVATKAVIAMIVQRFGFSVKPGIRIDRRVEITMGPDKGLPMHLHPPGRTHGAAAVRGNIHEMVTTRA